jgi:hypothetical protein
VDASTEIVCLFFVHSETMLGRAYRALIATLANTTFFSSADASAAGYGIFLQECRHLCGCAVVVLAQASTALVNMASVIITTAGSRYQERTLWRSSVAHSNAA